MTRILKCYRCGKQGGTFPYPRETGAKDRHFICFDCYEKIKAEKKAETPAPTGGPKTISPGAGLPDFVAIPNCEACQEVYLLTGKGNLKVPKCIP